jgi:hypothetical protein
MVNINFWTIKLAKYKFKDLIALVPFWYVSENYVHKCQMNFSQQYFGCIFPVIFLRRRTRSQSFDRDLQRRRCKFLQRHG